MFFTYPRIVDGVRVEFDPWEMGHHGIAMIGLDLHNANLYMPEP